MTNTVSQLTPTSYRQFRSSNQQSSPSQKGCKILRRYSQTGLYMVFVPGESQVGKVQYLIFFLFVLFLTLVEDRAYFTSVSQSAALTKSKQQLIPQLFQHTINHSIQSGGEKKILAYTEANESQNTVPVSRRNMGSLDCTLCLVSLSPMISVLI